MRKLFHYSPVLFIAALALFPSLALAFSWTSPADDKSLFYLGQIFGPVGTALAGSGNALIGALFKIFNIAVLSLGSIVVSYTIILSTINTAQEGEVMGRKWSSIWIPLRSALGMAFLLPTASGYSLIQVFMMQVIVWGVAAGNQVWQTVIAAMTSGAGVTGSVTVSGDKNTPIKQLFQSMVCAEAYNSLSDCAASLGSRAGMVQPYTQIIGNRAILYIGIPGDIDYSNLCGGIQSSGGPGNVDPTVWASHNAAAFQDAAGMMRVAAQATVAGGSGNLQGITATAVTYAASIVTQSLMALPTLPPTSSSSDMTQAINNGWIFAGSYYFQAVNQKGNAVYTFPGPLSANPPTGIATSCSIQVSGLLSTAASNLPANVDPGAGGSNGGGGSLSLSFQHGSVTSRAGPIYSAIANAVQSLAFKLMNTLTASKSDPVSSMREMGANIMSTTENIWFAVMGVAFAMLIAGCTMSGQSPLCWALGVIVTVLVPILTLIIALLWAAGAAIGIYVPMIPYLVFTFTALGWMLLVIETIAAAPIVALGLVSPAQEHLGRASVAVLLITNVFLRPSLMVIGFIISVKLVQAVITMVNFGFEATIKASVSSVGIFGAIALICLYGGLVIGILHECFSLVYLLPDKIIRWIGGHAESSSVRQQLQEAKETTAKGAQLGGGVMKGSAAFTQEKIGSQAIDKNPVGGGGGGMPGGGMPGGGEGGAGGGGGAGGANPLSGGGT